MFVMRTVDSRRPCSSVISISCVHRVRPSTMARHVPVTIPDVDRAAVRRVDLDADGHPARRRRAGPTRSSRATRPARREHRRAGCRRPACCPRPAWSRPSTRGSVRGIRCPSSGEIAAPGRESLEQFRMEFRGAVSSSSSVAIVSVRVSEPADRLSAVPDSEKPTLLLIDGHSLAFRAFYALPIDSFTTRDGQHTNAIHGFISMLTPAAAAAEADPPRRGVRHLAVVVPHARVRRVQGHPRRDPAGVQGPDPAAARGARRDGRADPHQGGLRGRRHPRDPRDARVRRTGSACWSPPATATRSSSSPTM